MRITDKMMNYSYMTNMNSSLSRQSSLQQQLADGQAIHRASDDPVKTTKVLTLNFSLAQNQNYSDNLTDAVAWMNNTDQAMSSLNSIATKAQELVVSADSTKNPTDLKAIATQLDSLINSAVDIGNTQVGDRYIFAGENDHVQPFQRITVAADPTTNSNKKVDLVSYSGDSTPVSMAVQTGTIDPTQDGVSLTGTDVFGASTSVYGQKTLQFFKQLIDIKEQLQAGQPVAQSNTTGGGGAVGAYQNFSVKVGSVDAVTGQVTSATYSTDGGTTWAKATMGAVGNPSTIGLANGISLTMAASLTDNVAGDKYDFTATQTGVGATTKTPGGGGTAVSTAAVIGTYTANSAMQGYQVKVAAVDPTTGQVTGASYTTDGGLNWQAAKVVAGNPSAVTLNNGIGINLGNTTTAGGDKYTFTASASGAGLVTKSNTTGSTGTAGGTYTGAAAAETFTVRIGTGGVGGVNPSGQVSAAEYSLDGGTTWTAATVAPGNPSKLTLTDGMTIDIAANTSSTVGDNYSFQVPISGAYVNSNVVVSQTNLNSGTPAITGAYTGSNYQDYDVRVDSVASTIDPITGKTVHQVSGASYSIDGGNTWVAVAPTALKQGDPTSVSMLNGVALNISANANTVAGDTYSFHVPQSTTFPDTGWLANTGTAYAKNIQEAMSIMQSKTGARSSMYQMNQTMMEGQKVVIHNDISDNMSINEAQAITDFTATQTCYKAALAVGAKIMQTSLADFLR